ncbi:MAG: hypothetical protein QXE05_08070 [Nitrososphaeria archaeon]
MNDKSLLIYLVVVIEISMLENFPIFSLANTEWFWLFLIIICIGVFIYLLIKRSRARERVRESIVLSIIRSRNGATIDDIIIGAHLSSNEANKELRKLLSRGVIKTVEREGKTYYVSA